MQSFSNIAIADLQVFPRDAEDVIPYDFIKPFCYIISNILIFESTLQSSVTP